MIFTRCAARVAKSLWSSTTPGCCNVVQLANFPYRTIISSFPPPRPSTPADPALLDPILAKWNLKQGTKFIVTVNSSGAPSVKSESFNPGKAYIKFSRSGKDWTKEECLPEGGSPIQHNFELDKIFDVKHEGKAVKEVVFTQVNKLLKQFEQVPTTPLIITEIQMEVTSPKTLIARYIVNMTVTQVNRYEKS